jgi:pyruvate/2-oxoglutarate dehydrogenase complex dihydrolipoamide acyltransferase (E2) component
VATTVGAPGVLIHADGVSTLDATTTGQVVKWWVSPNDLATKGAPLYSVQGTDGQVRTVAAPWDAYVVSVIVTNGQFVQPGTPIATLEEVTGPSDPLEAVVFMPAAAAPTIPLGIGVTVNAPSAPSSIFGTLRGTVASVGNFPETTDSLQAFLGEGVSTQSFLDSGSVVRVVIKLATEPGSSTKLVWSKEAPGYALDSDSSVQASFPVSNQHPIDWLFG